MNANELADEIQQISNRTVNLSDKVVIAHAGLKLRQQQAEIEALKAHPVKELTYEDGIEECAQRAEFYAYMREQY